MLPIALTLMLGLSAWKAWAITAVATAVALPFVLRIAR